MKIFVKSAIVATCVVVFAGCGGGNSSNQENNPSKLNIKGTLISNNFKIDIAKVEGYRSSDPIEDQYLTVINYLRSLKIKCNDPAAKTGPSAPMVWNQLLADAAKEHDDDMRLSQHYDHAGSGTANDITGQTFTPARASKFYERIGRTGFSATMTAENIAMSRTSPNPSSDDTWITIMEEWMKSTHGHCSNIMNPNLTKFGMHESESILGNDDSYRVYWSQEFGN